MHRLSVHTPLQNLGDTIASLPAIRKLIQMFSKTHTIYVWNNWGIFPNDVVGMSELSDKCISEPVCCGGAGYPIGFPEDTNRPFNITIKSHGHEKSVERKHLVDNAFACIGVTPTAEERNYPRFTRIEGFENITKKHVVMNIGYADTRRHFTEKFAKTMSDHIIKLGYIPVYVGTNRFKVLRFDLSGGVCLVDRLAVTDLATVIHRSKLVISADSGVIHVAGMTETPIVGFFTITDPEFRLPVRHGIQGWNCSVVVPYAECRFCGSRGESKDGKAIMSADHPCRTTPGGSDCVRMVNEEAVLHYLDKVLV